MRTRSAAGRPRWLPRWIAPAALVLLVLAAGGLLLAYVAESDGKLDAWHHALGRDFVNVWTAGHLVREGKVAEIFDFRTFWPEQRRLFDPRLPFHFWSYPPTALFLTLPLGWLPYIPALILWTTAGLVGLVAASRTFFGSPLDRWMLVLCPAVAVNIALGQNGAITAALLLGGLALMERRPAWAGVLFGLLAFKPQIGLLLPIPLLLERRWRTLGFAAGTAVGLTLLSAGVFGLEAWRGFFGPTLTTQSKMLTQGRGPFTWMMPSAYMSARVLKQPADVAMLIQAPFTLFAIWATVTGWRADRRGGGEPIVKAALLCAATFVASPQAFNYDLIPVQAAALVLGRRDERVTSLLLVIAVTALPAAMILLGEAKWPVAPLVLALLVWRLRVLSRKGCGTAPAPFPAAA